MGWNTVSLEVTGRVSRHNSDQDRKDDADFEEFCERVRMIAREHRYEALELEVFSSA